MAYILGQYNKNKTDPSDFFMTLITTGTVRRREVSGGDETGALSGMFSNECIQTQRMAVTNNYYFHGKIKRMASPQVFQIKLVNYSATPEEDIEQYIKTVTIADGNPDEWVDVEFCFTPYSDFDTILFDLKRTPDDYRVETRYPLIIYEEFSLINNIIPNIIRNGVSLIKFGLQSRPGLLMNINGEEIRTNRSGVYELQNGIILVTSFSVVAGGQETNSVVDNHMARMDREWEAANRISDVTQREAAKAAIGCVCCFNNPKTRSIDSFTLDYLYREE